jgi:two-component system nitrogen regulation response regulator GlnG/two-component system response regulator HydG
MSGETGHTTIITASERAPRGKVADAVTVLVIAWCSADPRRVGEIAVLPEKGSPLVLGREDPSAPAEARLRFFRQRPGKLERTDGFASRGLSRRQLLIESTPDGVRVKNVGQCSLTINGEACDGGLVAPGDVLQLRRELVFYCTRRPALIPPSRDFPSSAASAFGEPDTLGVLGEAPATWALRENIAFAAKAERHTLVLGESGTGKELAARAVHSMSSRAARRFVARNAATLPAGLVDAELFGNARNYPNPGMAERAGLIGEADGGTLFLDEIGELPIELQSHLLRVLDSDGEYQRLGDSSSRRSTFRLVAATNRSRGALKHDFAARFAAHIEVPSLDARREDIPLLAMHVLRLAAERSPQIASRFMDERHARIDPRLVEHLLQREYATNVRELDALLWRAMAASSGNSVELPPDEDGKRPSSPPSASPSVEPDLDAIKAALAAHDGSVPKAAKALGLKNRYVLYRLMTKHGLSAKG